MTKIEFKDVCYSTAQAEGSGVAIIQEVAFQVEEGETFTILGPSGSGKSTLLRLANRLLEPTKGVIVFDGKSLGEMSVIELRRKIGLVLQTPVLMKDLNLRDNLLYGMHCHQGKSERDAELAEALLERVGLPVEILDRDYEEISVGQAQRLCLARTLANDPEVLLLDEPTSSLDPTARTGIENLIQSLQNGQNLTLVFVTHDLAQAQRLGGRAGVLVKGRLVEMGPIEEVLRSPREEVTRKFVSGELDQEGN